MFESVEAAFAAPVAAVVVVEQAFDEQRLKAEWDAACADEKDAVERKAAVLRAAVKCWPKVLSSQPGLRAQGRMVYAPEMRRFVREVLGIPDNKEGSINEYARRLLNHPIAVIRERNLKQHNRTTLIRQAAIGFLTAYELEPDPAMQDEIARVGMKRLRKVVDGTDLS